MALAVSPPAVENAKGKLLAPKTVTGPRPTFVFRMSGFGGVRDSWASGVVYRQDSAAIYHRNVPASSSTGHSAKLIFLLTRNGSVVRAADGFRFLTSPSNS